MKIEVKVPSPGESITQVQLASWLVKNGFFVEKDTEIAEIDSDKATLSISAEEEGEIAILIEEGETIEVGATIATIDTKAKKPERKSSDNESLQTKKADTPEKEADKKPASQKVEDKQKTIEEDKPLHFSPLAKKLMQENNISKSEITTFFKNLRVNKDDVAFYLENKGAKGQFSGIVEDEWDGKRTSERQKMSTLRLKLSERLVTVKNETAMLTTFNEVNMAPVMELRKKYKELFKETHEVSLGFMSFFAKAITEAMRDFPMINSMLDKDEVVIYKFVDIGIAVSAPKGLMVPIIRNAEKLSFAEIEKKVNELAIKARNNKLSLDEMTGGTFTITNGGVFGSMMSTPILNPPQSAILGMHNIVDRPVAINGKVEIKPIMYIALSYDHRLIDGRDSVSFLVKVKELLENPVRMLFAGKDPDRLLLNI